MTHNRCLRGSTARYHHTIKSHSHHVPSYSTGSITHDTTSRRFVKSHHTYRTRYLTSHTKCRHGPHHLNSDASGQSSFSTRFPRGVPLAARVRGVLWLRRMRGADRPHGSAAVEGGPGVDGALVVGWDAGGDFYLHPRCQMVRNLRGRPGGGWWVGWMDYGVVISVPPAAELFGINGSGCVGGINDALNERTHTVYTITGAMLTQPPMR